MKSFALLVCCVALVTGTIGFAQQQPEWRPSVAEDNKSASLTDTLAFMKGILTTAENATVPHGGELFLTSFEADKCSVHIVRGVRDAFDPLFVDSVRLDLSAIDPLSVVVKPGKDNGHIPFFVYLSGTNNSKFAFGERARYQPDSDKMDTSKGGVYRSKPYQELSAASAPCMEGKNKTYHGVPYVATKLGACTMQPIDDFTYSFPFADMETAKRVARAAMHAALLCGGTKSVSPF
jgi:hypothetical protein